MLELQKQYRQACFINGHSMSIIVTVSLIIILDPYKLTLIIKEVLIFSILSLICFVTVDFLILSLIF